MGISKYSDELALERCHFIAMGMSLIRACQQPGIPAIRTVMNWRHQYPGFQTMLDQARLDHCDTLADEVCDIADNDPDPQRARNRIEARKWRAATIKPRTYGPKMEVRLEVHRPTDFGALLERARARVVRMARQAELGTTIEGEAIKIPEPAVAQEVDPFS